MNRTISFLIEKHIYVEDVKDDTEAIQKASDHLLDILNRRGINGYAKIDPSMQSIDEKKEDKNVQYSVL